MPATTSTGTVNIKNLRISVVSCRAGSDDHTHADTEKCGKRVHYSPQTGRVPVTLKADSLAKNLEKGEDNVKVTCIQVQFSRIAEDLAKRVRNTPVAGSPRNSSCAYLPVKNAMPRAATRVIDDPQVYACASCQTHLSTEGRVISKAFQTQNGRGYLIGNVINVTNGPSTKRHLLTGLHACEDVYCVTCNVMVGWEYKWALEEEQRSKVGNFVLEEVKIMRYHWESD